MAEKMVSKPVLEQLHINTIRCAWYFPFCEAMVEIFAFKIANGGRMCPLALTEATTVMFDLLPLPVCRNLPLALFSTNPLLWGVKRHTSLIHIVDLTWLV